MDRHFVSFASFKAPFTKKGCVHQACAACKFSGVMTESGMLKELGVASIFALGAYSVIAVVLFALQRSLLYYPSDFKPTKDMLAEANLRYWPSAENYRGFIAATEVPDIKGTVIVFHGNAGTAYHRSFYVNALSRKNLRVILAEYPGYGGRSGNPSESTLVSDAVATVQFAFQTYGEPIYLWGESLGSGVVAGVVTQTGIPLKGLVLFLPWDSLPSLAQTHYRFFPARWLVLDKYDNVINLQQFKGRVAVLLAERDAVVPVKHGTKLYESLGTDKKLWLFDGAGHNSVPVAANLSWWQEVSDFISQ